MIDPMILFYFLVLLLISFMIMIILEFDSRQTDYDYNRPNENSDSHPEIKINSNNELSELNTELSTTDWLDNSLVLEEFRPIFSSDSESNINSLKKELKQNLKTLSYIHDLESEFRAGTNTRALEDIFELRSKLRVRTLRITQKIRKYKTVQSNGDDEPNAA